jgi:hypothetical protein
MHNGAYLPVYSWTVRQGALPDAGVFLFLRCDEFMLTLGCEAYRKPVLFLAGCCGTYGKHVGLVCFAASSAEQDL